MKIQIDCRPPSVNGYYRYTSRGGYITARGREFKDYVELHLRNLINTRKIESYGLTKLSFGIDLHFKGKRKLDADNYIKPIIDCFKGIVFDDDDQIMEIHVKKFQPDEADWFIVTITPVT